MLNIKTKLLLLLFFMFLGITVFPILVDSLIYNLVIISSGVRTEKPDGPGSIWYGMGLQKLSNDEAASLIEWASLLKTKKSICSHQEQRTLEKYLKLPVQMGSTKKYQDKNLALHARQKHCIENDTDALRILEQGNQKDFSIQRISILNSNNDLIEAYHLAQKLTCEIDAEWCKWCFQQMYNIVDEADNQDSAEEITQYSSHQPDETYDEIFTHTIEIPGFVNNPNVAISRRVPFVVSNVAPAAIGDNYIEYSKSQITGNAVNLHLRGTVLETDKNSCINPRIVFWDEGGNYLGEVTQSFEINGNFDVNLWWPLNEEVIELTPRISFDHSCFTENQKIAICAVELIYSKQ